MRQARQDAEEQELIEEKRLPSSGSLLGEGTGVKVHFLFQAGTALAQLR